MSVPTGNEGLANGRSGAVWGHTSIKTRPNGIFFAPWNAAGAKVAGCGLEQAGGHFLWAG